MSHLSPLTLIAVVCAAISATIIVIYLVMRPHLGHATKVWLLLGLVIYGLYGYKNSRLRGRAES